MGGEDKKEMQGRTERKGGMAKPMWLEPRVWDEVVKTRKCVRISMKMIQREIMMQKEHRRKVLEKAREDSIQNTRGLV